MGDDAAEYEKYIYLYIENVDHQHTLGFRKLFGLQIVLLASEKRVVRLR